MEGWIKLDRKILDWEWYDDSKMVHLFIHLLLKANHEECCWHGETIKRGQLVSGREKLSLGTGLSERSVRTCLEKLAKTGEIVIKTTNKYSIITICNYDSYKTNYNSSDQQTTNKKPTKSQQTTTNNNIIESFTNVNNSSVHEKESKEKKYRRKKEDVITDEKGNPALFALDEGRKPQQRKKEFNPPAIDDVVSFFESRGLDREKAELFFYHYDGLGWKNTNGTKIHNWESTANKWILEDKINKSNSNLKQNERSSNFRSVDDIAEQDRAKRQQEVAELVRQSLYDDSGPVASDVW